MWCTIPNDVVERWNEKLVCLLFLNCWLPSIPLIYADLCVGYAARFSSPTVIHERAPKPTAFSSSTVSYRVLFQDCRFQNDESEFSSRKLRRCRCPCCRMMLLAPPSRHCCIDCWYRHVCLRRPLVFKGLLT